MHLRAAAQKTVEPDVKPGGIPRARPCGVAIGVAEVLMKALEDA